MESVGPDLSWSKLYRAGGISGLVFVVLVLVPVALVFIAPLPPTEGHALLQYIAAHKAVYLTELVCFVGLAVPALVVFAAITAAVKHVDKSVAAIGALFGIGSEIIALALGSSPQSLHGGLVVLADGYATAATDSQRASLASSADTLIAATNAVSWAGILTAAAILLLSLLMRGSFGSLTAVWGIITGAIGIPSEALRPLIGPLYMAYGLALPVWFALVARKLVKISRDREEQ